MKERLEKPEATHAEMLSSDEAVAIQRYRDECRKWAVSFSKNDTALETKDTDLFYETLERVANMLPIMHTAYIRDESYAGPFAKFVFEMIQRATYEVALRKYGEQHVPEAFEMFIRGFKGWIDTTFTKPKLN